MDSDPVSHVLTSPTGMSFGCFTYLVASMDGNSMFRPSGSSPAAGDLYITSYVPWTWIQCPIPFPVPLECISGVLPVWLLPWTETQCSVHLGVPLQLGTYILHPMFHPFAIPLQLGVYILHTVIYGLGLCLPSVILHFVQVFYLSTCFPWTDIAPDQKYSKPTSGGP